MVDTPTIGTNVNIVLEPAKFSQSKAGLEQNEDNTVYM
jgi:hypothetical protein